MVNSPTQYFVLTGIIVHELRWQQCLSDLVEFRQQIRLKFGLKLREELHCAALMNRPGKLVRIKRNDRLTVVRSFADRLSTMLDINVINVVVDKAGKPLDYDVFSAAWRALIQRFENTLSHHNFTGPANADERGMLFPDHTDEKKLRELLRQMRRYNPVPNKTQYGIGYRNLALANIIEDPNLRNSLHSYFVQAADAVAFLLYQSLQPSGYMRKKSGQNYFRRLDPILCRAASSSDRLGVVRL